MIEYKIYINKIDYIIITKMNRKIVISSWKMPNTLHQVGLKPSKTPSLSTHAAKIVIGIGDIGREINEVERGSYREEEKQLETETR
jgi:hypothetical protein